MGGGVYGDKDLSTLHLGSGGGCDKMNHSAGSGGGAVKLETYRLVIDRQMEVEGDVVEVGVVDQFILLLNKFRWVQVRRLKQWAGIVMIV